MPAKGSSINLIEKDDFEHTSIGRLTMWAVTYGRYIMVGTEVVVLLAFISRFSLDRKLTDLKEEISQKQAILEANQDFEQEYQSLQNRLTTVGKLLNGQTQPFNALSSMQSLLPQGVYLQAYDYQKNKITIEATAGNTQSFAQYLANIQASKQITQIEIGDIRKQPLTGIQFRLTAVYAEDTK